MFVMKFFCKIKLSKEAGLTKMIKINFCDVILFFIGKGLLKLFYLRNYFFLMAYEQFKSDVTNRNCQVWLGTGLKIIVGVEILEN